MAVLTLNDLLILLAVVAMAMLIVLLYHLIFASISLKRTARRLDRLSEDLETVILKPIGAVDYVIDWFLAAVEGVKGSKKKHGHEGK